MRSGSQARGLSEGEETAIALLYFLKSLEDQRFDLAQGLVVLDDPVSSLDGNSLFLACGYIRSRLKSARQLIILTHNFSFFRQIRDWFKNLRGQDRRQAAFYMLEATTEDAGRVSTIRPLDPLLFSYESEYHYLFARLWRETQATGAPNLEAHYVLPNIARRLLEAFLAFRQPGQGTLEQRLMALHGEEAQKLRVLRFLHAQSHGEDMVEPEHDASHLAEAPRALGDLFALVERADPEHYAAMIDLCSRPDSADDGSDPPAA